MRGVGGRWLEERPPFVDLYQGPKRLCEECGGIVLDDDKTECPTCGGTSLLERRLIEPLGFRTDYRKGGDYDWEVERFSRGQPARIARSPQGHSERRGNALIRVDRGDLFVVNDRSGAGFLVGDATRFPSGRVDGLIATDLAEEARMSPAEAGEPPAALVCRTLTDFLTIAADASLPESVLWRPSGVNDARWAAWTSLATLFAQAAARVLNVDRREFDVAAYYLGQESYGIFIADVLENGAGFAQKLADRATFELLLGDIGQSQRDIFERPKHRENCTASCYDCLRNYDNMRLHELLDWRLGLELFDELFGKGRRPYDDVYLSRAAEVIAKMDPSLRLEACGDLVRAYRNGTPLEFASCFDPKVDIGRDVALIPFYVLRGRVLTH